MSHKLDVIGDVHGQYTALVKLGTHLGYDVGNGWHHPDGRVLVFVGDLIDRGEHSLEVSELVLSLVRARRAVCLMGNHEYNLVKYNLGLDKPKKSNRKTVLDLGARHQRWAPVLEFFRTLPLALDLPELRVIHAVWHREFYAAVSEVLRERAAAPATTTDAGPGTIEWVRSHVSLSSPFDGAGLHARLPTERLPGQEDLPHEILIKGHEERADAKFLDSDGREREDVRVAWWLNDHPQVPGDKVTVFGHYWNLPPVPGRHEATAPPHPSGHPRLRAWQTEHAPIVPSTGTVDAPRAAKFVCVDYNGVFVGGGGACVGAYRWPEHQVAWVTDETAAKTST